MLRAYKSRHDHSAAVGTDKVWELRVGVIVNQDAHLLHHLPTWSRLFTGSGSLRAFLVSLSCLTNMNSEL